MGRRIPAKQYCFEYMDENAAKTTENGKTGKTKKAGKLPALQIAIRDRLDQMSLAIAMAVSDMRLEKPHSLSYQDRTDTNVPSMTLVWSSATVEECGS